MAGTKFASGSTQVVSVPLTVTANSTVYTGVLAVQRDVNVSKASVAFKSAPVSSNGTVTLALSNYDASASAADNLLSTATVSLESLSDNTPSDLTLTSTSGDLQLSDGDYVYVTAVSNNSDMTGGTGGVLTLEVHPR